MSNSFIWPIYISMSGSTTPGQSGPGSNYRSPTIRLFSFISRTLVGVGWGLIPQHICSRCILRLLFMQEQAGWSLGLELKYKKAILFWYCDNIIWKIISFKYLSPSTTHSWRFILKFCCTCRDAACIIASTYCLKFYV